MKNISQQAHNSFIALQSAERFCNEELSWLNPTFNLWGPYMQFLDKLIVLMAKKPDLLDKIFTVKENIEMVKDLSGFFAGKIQAIQGKLKFLSDGIEPCVPSVIDAINNLRDWQEWSTSFDDILTWETIVAILEDTSIFPFHTLIDSLFKAEIDLNKFFVEAKAIMNARWTKTMQDFQVVKEIEWPTKREIYVWEAIGEIKAFPV